jgi:hypothetical protein
MGQAEERTCDLRLWLFRWGTVQTSYEAKAGLKRSLTLLGHVDDPYHRGGSLDISAPHFHGKPVRVGIHSQDDAEWLTNIRAKSGVPHACGNVLVRAGIEPDRFESDGETLHSRPAPLAR